MKYKHSAEISITPERVREVFSYNPETGDLIWLIRTSNRAKIGEVAGSLQKDHGYIQIRVDGVRYAAHRLIWLHVYGKWPVDQIDHINGNRSDNRLCNLREATNGQNTMNQSRRSDNTSGYKGVWFSKPSNKWCAMLKCQGKTVYLGLFGCPTAAYIAYVIAAKKYFGSFAKIA